MSRPAWWRALTLLAAGVGLVPALWAMEHSLKASTQNYSTVPVLARSSTAVLVEETVALGSESGSASSGRSQASRTLVSGGATGSHTLMSGGGQPSPAASTSTFVSSNTLPTRSTGVSYLLKGEVKCWNKSPNGVEAIGVMVLPFDADHNAYSDGRNNLLRLDGTIIGGAEVTLPWKVPVTERTMVEVVVAILTIKFANGTIWKAPDVEIVDFF